MNLTWGHLRSLRLKKWGQILNNLKWTKLTLPECWSGSNIKKVSTVTSSPDLWLRGQRSKKIKSANNVDNDKSNTVNVFILVKHQKGSQW